ncbi:hypothetical protein JHL21_16075 [Devosia sp. WQ 349]|uniref:lipopolysaccharide biosynthesis protein n=1 Tax=Devosia sp. WQ 349K1 TaxID=2800329 RepID=UPI001904C773|nr:hypothetical protein [Devosia sp. WQ 349K1]MBK1796010.1 hypothetical protein [Devosia sp. WQ 349K1]
MRIGTLVTRFVFVFFLARYLDVDLVGYYGLFTAAVGYCLYFVGVDFYVYATREIIQVEGGRRGSMLKGQVALSCLIYLVVIPIALVVLMQFDWPVGLVWWFVPILVLEHFNQEISRLLVALSEQVFSSFVLFVRQGSWALVAVALMSWGEGGRSLELVMVLWACAGLVAAALGVWKLKRLDIGGWGDAIDWKWVRRGLAVGGAFLAATLALRGMQTVDRYWLEALAGIEIVGVYVLFLGITGAMLTFLDAGIFAFGYPALIAYNHGKQHDLARARVREMLWQTIVVCLGFGIVSWLVLPYLLAWIGNAAYADGMFLYPWLWAAMTINAVGLVPHYGLYGAGHDKPIIQSHLASLPIFALTAFGVGLVSPTLAVPVGLVAAFFGILVWKTVAYLRMSKS